MPSRTHTFTSRAVSFATYDPDTQVLEVTFNTGRTYTHPGVPESVFEDFISAPSAGSFYGSQIKGQYR